MNVVGTSTSAAKWEGLPPKETVHSKTRLLGLSLLKDMACWKVRVIYFAYILGYNQVMMLDRRPCLTGVIILHPEIAAQHAALGMQERHSVVTVKIFIQCVR